MAFFLGVGISDLAEILFESDFDIPNADIEISDAFFELSASKSEVAFHLIEETIIKRMIDSRVIGVEEAASMDGLDHFVAIVLPAVAFAEVSGQVHREGVVLRERSHLAEEQPA